MGVLISPIVRTSRDIAGNPLVEVYSIFEYQSTGILPTGESIDLSNYMRRVEYVQAQPISGALLHEPRPNASDFPGNAGSGRMELHSTGSGLVTLNISGLPIQIVSGAATGVAASGLFATSNVLPALSGRIGVVGSGAFNGYIQRTALLSGTAVSGARAYIHAFGY